MVFPPHAAGLRTGLELWFFFFSVCLCCNLLIKPCQVDDTVSSESSMAEHVHMRIGTMYRQLVDTMFGTFEAHGHDVKVS